MKRIFISCIILATLISCQGNKTAPVNNETGEMLSQQSKTVNAKDAKSLRKVRNYLNISKLIFASFAKKPCDFAVKSFSQQPHNSCNSVYYWKTTFKLSDEEQLFIADHQVQRMYLRYFDVARDADFGYETIPVPVATLLFLDSIPSDLEVVPTVFIDNELFKSCDMTDIPSKMVERISKMSDTNDVPNVKEIQIDCDWTKTTETVYFDFLRQIRQELDSTTLLSATIRLHQLSMQAPPVDRGVLMCYNTGGIRNPQTVNSILSANDVALYSKKVKDYALPLDVAYPAFSWAVWFSAGQFQALLRGLTCDNENLSPKKDNVYTVKNGFYQEGKYLAAGDEIRFEDSDWEEIRKTKEMIENQLTDYSVILYHLDNNNLSKYTSDEINQIYAY